MFWQAVRIKQALKRVCLSSERVVMFELMHPDAHVINRESSAAGGTQCSTLSQRNTPNLFACVRVC